MKFLSLFLALLLLFAHVTALSQDYDQGPAPISDKAQLHWTLNNATRRISLAITVKDSAVLSDSGAAWIAFGVSEETSGSMLGSDIASAEFGPGMLNNCTLRDRHVPFAAYPIGEGIDNATSVYPDQDDCQIDGSWNLIACKRDLGNGSATLELERSLDAHDDQDRPINPGSQAVIYAYGGQAFTYHGKMRGSSRVVFYNDDGTYPFAEELPLPKDITFTHTVLATNYSVPSVNVTTYACTSSVVPIPKGGKRSLVAVDPIIKSASGKNKAHHLLVYACKDTAYARSFLKTNYCMDDGPGGPNSQCQAFVYGWAIGAGRFLLPDEVGFEIDESNSFLIMETHYDNPDQATDAVDISGAKLYFADSRPILAGQLTLGDPGVSLFGQKVKHEFEYMSTCPSNCTSAFKEEINVFSSQLHMHTTGRKIYTNRFDKDGNFIETINAIEYWSNDHQYIKEFRKPKKIAPGDTLSTTCVFDTRKRPSTKFGLETKDEMCIDFIFYYPLQKRNESDSAIFLCSMAHYGNGTGTLCGSPENQNVFLFQENPSFNDTVDTPEKFGDAPTVCAAASSGDAKPVNGTNDASGTNGTNGTSGTNSTSARCFPGSGVVQTRLGKRRMSDLHIGDEVLVSNGTYSTVFMFTHRLPTGRRPFVELATAKHSVTLTVEHYLYVNNALVPAGEVQVGDMLRGEDGEMENVVRVRNVVKEGLYNPQTLQGDIVVDGIISSTYTKAVEPRAAHALLTPMRAVMEAFGWSVAAFERDEYTSVRAFNMIRSLV